MIARVRLDRLTTEAYSYCFKSIFETASREFPKFTVGKSLQGIVVDWSDQQMKGLEAVVGAETASQVAKGCRVHFTRSVKRVSERVNKNNLLAHKAFTTIAYQIPNALTEADALCLFDVLAGESDISNALALCHHGSTLMQYAEVHHPETWKPLKH